jgi:RNA-directed DNA polymerase
VAAVAPQRRGVVQREDLARNLAVSLVGGDWSEAALRGVLERRLPRALRKAAPALAARLVERLPGPVAPPVDRVAAALAAEPRFEGVHGFCARRSVWPDPDLTSPRMAPVAALAGYGVPDLPTAAALAEWLAIPVERLDYVADVTGRHAAHDEMAVNHYTYAVLRRPDGRVRVIEAPKPGLKALQRRILRGIVGKVPVHADAFAFVPGRSCREGAARHAGEAVVLRFDLRDFFPSLGAGRVQGLFRLAGYPEPVARLLTGLCTTRTPLRVVDRFPAAERAIWRARHLPQGAPTSPALANLAVFGLDRRLAGLARSLGAAYSRYADDMTFSGDIGIAEPLLQIVPAIVAEEGLVLNCAKTRVMRATGRQVVTGIVVNRAINIDRRDYDRLKAVIHACGRPGDGRLDDPSFRARIVGQIDWVGSVSAAKGEKLRALLVRAAERRAAGQGAGETAIAGLVRHSAAMLITGSMPERMSSARWHLI